MAAPAQFPVSDIILFILLLSPAVYYLIRLEQTSLTERFAYIIRKYLLKQIQYFLNIFPVWMRAFSYADKIHTYFEQDKNIQHQDWQPKKYYHPDTSDNRYMHYENSFIRLGHQFAYGHGQVFFFLR